MDNKNTAFVIPKKRKAEEPLQEVIDDGASSSFTSDIPGGYEIKEATPEEKQQVIAQISKKSTEKFTRSEEAWKNMKVQNVKMIQNAKLENYFEHYKRLMKNKQEGLAYRVVFEQKDIEEIAENGLRVNIDPIIDIGDPTKGVMLYSSPAFAYGARYLYTDVQVKVIVFRTATGGKRLEVPLSSGSVSPSKKHNSHVLMKTESNSIKFHRLSLEHLLNGVYHYEYFENSSDLHSHLPTVLPYAIISYELQPPTNQQKAISKINRLFPSFSPVQDDATHSISLGTSSLFIANVWKPPTTKVVVPILRQTPATVESVRMKHIDWYPELEMLRSKEYFGKLLRSETVYAQGFGAYSYYILTLAEEGKAIFDLLLEGNMFLVWNNKPWTVFYLPTGAIATEFGFPHIPNSFHTIVRREDVDGVKSNHSASVEYIDMTSFWLAADEMEKIPREREEFFEEEDRDGDDEIEDESTVGSGLTPASPQSSPAVPVVVKAPQYSQVPNGILRTINRKPRDKTVRWNDEGYPERPNHIPGELTSVRFFDNDTAFTAESQKLSFAEKKKQEHLNEMEAKHRIKEEQLKALKAIEEEKMQKAANFEFRKVMQGVSSAPTTPVHHEPDPTSTPCYNIPPPTLLNIPQTNVPPPPLAPLVTSSSSTKVSVSPSFPTPPPSVTMIQQDPLSLPLHRPRPAYPPVSIPAPPVISHPLIDVGIPPPNFAVAPPTVVTLPNMSKPPPLNLPSFNQPPPIASSSKFNQPESVNPTAQTSGFPPPRLVIPLLATPKPLPILASMPKPKEVQHVQQAPPAPSIMISPVVSLPVAAETLSSSSIPAELEEKGEESMEIDEEEDDEGNVMDKGEDNDILRAVFQSGSKPEPSKAPEAIDHISKKLFNEVVGSASFIKILEQRKEESKKRDGKPSQDTDLRTPVPSVNFSINAKPLVSKPIANVLQSSANDDEDDLITQDQQPGTSSQDSDYRKSAPVRPRTSRDSFPKDRDDREKDTDDRINNIPFPKQSAESEAIKRKSDLLQGKLRATDKERESMLANPSIDVFNMFPNIAKYSGGSVVKNSEISTLSSSEVSNEPTPFVPRTFLQQESSKETIDVNTDAQNNRSDSDIPSSSTGRKSPQKKSPKKPIDFDSVNPNTSDFRARESWNNSVEQKSQAKQKESSVKKIDIITLSSDEEEGELPKSSESNSSVNFLSRNALDAPPGITTRVGLLGDRPSALPQSRINGPGQMRNSPNLMNGPQPPWADGRGGVNMNGERQQQSGNNYNPPQEKNPWMASLTQIVDPTADNYSIMIDPTLNVNQINPDELSKLFAGLSALKRARLPVTPRIHSDVFIHLSHFNLMVPSAPGKGDQKKFFHSYNQYLNCKPPLVQVLPRHTRCDGSFISLEDLSTCLFEIHKRRNSKEAIFITHRFEEASKEGKLMTENGIKVMTIWQLGQFIEKRTGESFNFR